MCCVEEALDYDAAALVPGLDAAVVQLGTSLRRVLRVVSQNRYHADQAVAQRKCGRHDTENRSKKCVPDTH